MASPLVIEISELKFNRTRCTQQLLFSLTWKIECEYGVIGGCTERCRMQRNPNGGELWWQGPWALMRTRVLLTKFTQDLHDLVLSVFREKYPQYLEKIYCNSYEGSKNLIDANVLVGEVEPPKESQVEILKEAPKKKRGRPKKTT